MPDEVDTVNIPYHHGHLRSALIDAGLALARPQGPESVVLRAASRAAGVSHGAAYRHFADRAELLTAVCARCMSHLALLMETRLSELPLQSDRSTAAQERLAATGRAYIEFALSEPGWFRTAFAVPSGRSFAPGEGVGHSGLGPYEILAGALDALVDAGELDPRRRPHAEFAAWSAVHGLSTLLIDGPLRDLPESDRQIAIDKVLEVVSVGLGPDLLEANDPPESPGS